MKPWIEAMRLRTLPVSIAGVMGGTAVAAEYASVKWQPALICLVFALCAQIVSNFANEYYDFKNGFDKKGREGFRRGVTEGDIKASSMKKAMIGLMAFACLLGCTLIYWGGVWLIAIGLLVAIGAFAYSAGPWPLSHHGLGDEAVVVFYGIIPVMLTAYLQCGSWEGGEPATQLGAMWQTALTVSIGIGLLGTNVLTVNNIRDVRDDEAVGKRTKAVILGPEIMRWAYVATTVAGLLLLWFGFRKGIPAWGWAGYAAVGIWYVPVIWALFTQSGVRLNKVLKITAMLLLVAVVWSLVAVGMGN